MTEAEKIVGGYAVEKTIGEGSFGKVKLGIHLKTREKVHFLCYYCCFFFINN